MVTWVGRGTSQGLQEEYALKEIQRSGVETRGAHIPSFLPGDSAMQPDGGGRWGCWGALEVYKPASVLMLTSAFLGWPHRQG